MRVLSFEALKRQSSHRKAKLRAALDRIAELEAQRGQLLAMLQTYERLLQQTPDDRLSKLELQVQRQQHWIETAIDGLRCAAHSAAKIWHHQQENNTNQQA